MRTQTLIKVFSPDPEKGTVKRNTYKTKAGYVFCNYNQKTFYVHRIIWQSVNGPIPKGKEINHKDLNKQNNSISNLELVSRKQNIRHAISILKTFKPRKLTDEQRRQKNINNTRRWEASLSPKEMEEFRERQRIASLRYYHRHKEEIKERKRKQSTLK